MIVACTVLENPYLTMGWPIRRIYAFLLCACFREHVLDAGGR
jgi:hypothetical protein